MARGINYSTSAGKMICFQRQTATLWNNLANKVWDSRCLRAEPDGVWPTFGFPGESTASCPGSCTGPPRPATARQGVTFCILLERNSPKHTKLDNVKQKKRKKLISCHIRSIAAPKKEGSLQLPAWLHCECRPLTCRWRRHSLKPWANMVTTSLWSSSSCCTSLQ